MPCRPLSCWCGNYIAPMHHVQAVLVLFGLMVMYGHRVSINIALVEMVPPFKPKTGSLACPTETGEAPTIKNISGGVYNWDQTTQSYIIGGFYVGYAVLQLPAGILIDMYGSRIFLLLGMGVSTLMTALVPILVKYTHWITLVISRIIMGCAQSVIYPCIAYVLSHWIPPEEWSTISSICMSGMALGTVIGNICTGFILKLCHSWIIAFYFWTGVGCFWIIFCFFYGYDFPEKHKNLTDKEREMLTEKLQIKVKQKSPFLSIILDPVTWALTVCAVVNDYAFYTILNNLPKYMNNVLGFEIGKNAIHNSLPQLLLYISSVTSGKISDCIVRRTNVVILWTRVFMTFIGTVISPIFIVAAAYIGCNRILVILCFNACLFFKGPIYGGLKVNILDVTLNYSATMIAIMNGLAAATGFISPTIISTLAPDNSLKQFQLVFWVVLVVNVVGFLFYFCFTKGTRRKWDYSIEEQASLPPKSKNCCRVFSCYHPRGDNPEVTK